MKDWNVVVSIYQDGFKPALRALRKIGLVDPSPFHNVLVMKAADPAALLDAIEKKTVEDPALYDSISRVAPAARDFEFDSAEDFRSKATSVLLDWAPQLACRSFHVRFHHRGSPYDLPTPDIERFLDEALLDALQKAGAPGKISFSNPDAVIAIDTIANRAGLGLWTREDLARHRLLRPD